MPVRGRWWLGGRPLVHRGFWEAWSAHGVGDKVLEHVGAILKSSKLPVSDWTVLLTGRPHAMYQPQSQTLASNPDNDSPTHALIHTLITILSDD